MKLESQVCTLLQAKRLKELGIEQGSLFVYYDNMALKTDNGLLYYKDTASYKEFGKVESRSAIRYYPAFTVAELGQMLPDNHFSIRSTIDNVSGWEYFKNGSLMPMVDAETEAECRAYILIHLLENNLVTASDCNKRLAS